MLELCDLENIRAQGQAAHRQGIQNAKKANAKAAADAAKYADEHVIELALNKIALTLPKLGEAAVDLTLFAPLSALGNTTGCEILSQAAVAGVDGLRQKMLSTFGTSCLGTDEELVQSSTTELFFRINPAVLIGMGLQEGLNILDEFYTHAATWSAGVSSVAEYKKQLAAGDPILKTGHVVFNIGKIAAGIAMTLSGARALSLCQSYGIEK